MEKRLITAIILSILIIVTFQYLFVKPVAKMAQPEKVELLPQPVLQKTETLPEAAKKILPEEKLFEINTQRLIIDISNLGGSIKTIRLKDYKEIRSTEPLHLVNIEDPEFYIFALTDPLLARPLAVSSYDISRHDNTITCSLKLKEVEVIKKYEIHKSNYAIKLQLIIKNISSEPINFIYRINGGSGLIEPNAADKKLVEVTSKIDEKNIGFKNPKGGRITIPGTVSWTALKSKYFSIVLKPLISTRNEFYTEYNGGYLLTGVESQDINILPGAMVEQQFVLYAGPSKISNLKAAGYDFEETINYGFFGWIAKAMLSAMGLFYGIVHSWGISIILLAVLLNIILFPLTMQSFNSMRKMQELHPQMEKLKAENKNNPQKLNKEMMELYKKYKINPLSGCLPLLLQMPIFIALYQALMKSIDLRGAAFLWIKDLSGPDAVPLPFTLPLLGNSVNILPILMIICMVVQQKISSKATGGAVTEEQKQQQKMMLILMPIMFGFIFYNMPSGLVLYWVINTLLTVVEQAFILRNT